MAHLILHTSGGDRKIYVLGYADKARWKKALGGQYGCLYIDEINIADMEFVREASMRLRLSAGHPQPRRPGPAGLCGVHQPQQASAALGGRHPARNIEGAEPGTQARLGSLVLFFSAQCGTVPGQDPAHSQHGAAGDQAL